MGDISAEPSMEEILSSIKRIIAEEGDAATGARTRRAARAAPRPDPVSDEVLELSDPVAEELEPAAAPSITPVQPATPAPMTIGAPDVPPHPEQILSDRVLEATRGPLAALTKIVEQPEAPEQPAPAMPGSLTIEGLVREMLKPMLSEWLDANLPQIVETMVAKEIARITGR